MALRFVDLWRWNGRVSRRTYGFIGIVGFLVKNNLDRLVGLHYIGKQSILFNYWLPLGKAERLNQLSSTEMRYLATLLVVAIPFIWIGVATTVRRLRDAGQPVWLVVLFFLPFLNLLFFAALCFLPSRPVATEKEATPWPGPRALDGILPRSELGSAALAVLVTALIGSLFVVLGTSAIGAYGWSLFVALPFCLGLFAVLLHSYHGPRDVGTCMGVALLPVALLGLLLLAVAIEGIVCLMMAAPLALGLALLGGLLGYGIQATYWAAKGAEVMLSVVLLVMPAMFGIEHAARLEVPTSVVRTSIDIQAPREQVWQQVVAFAEIPPPTEVLFRAGIAYPIRAEITGRGPGAMRRCIFSTGAFLEPIEVWDEPRVLKFGVTASPAPLNEMTPYGHIEPRHLHGYFVSEEGQFLLTALPNGGTRLEGTTRYRNAIWPAAYWHIWSDYIIHRIHLRVLRHIKEAAEHSRTSG